MIDAKIKNGCNTEGIQYILKQIYGKFILKPSNYTYSLPNRITEIALCLYLYPYDQKGTLRPRHCLF